MHPDRRKPVAERVGNRGRIASARSVWLLFRCAAKGCPSPSAIEVYGTKDAAAKAMGSCMIEGPERCRMERFVPASMRRRARST